jgi:hypothetical protein
MTTRYIRPRAPESVRIDVQNLRLLHGRSMRALSFFAMSLGALVGLATLAFSTLGDARTLGHRCAALAIPAIATLVFGSRWIEASRAAEAIEQRLI